MVLEMVMARAKGMAVETEMVVAVERVLETAAAGIWEMVRGLSVKNRKTKVKL